MKTNPSIVKVLTITFAALTSAFCGQLSFACTGKDDALPHATKIEVVQMGGHTATLRIHEPHWFTRYAGGAPGKVYYSRLKNPAAICRDLVFDTGRVKWASVADQSQFEQVAAGREPARFSYLKKSARYEKRRRPGRMSEFYFHTIYSMKDDDYAEFSKHPSLAPAQNLMNVDCEVHF